jgi:hypothetical protein
MHILKLAQTVTATVTCYFCSVFFLSFCYFCSVLFFSLWDKNKTTGDMWDKNKTTGDRFKQLVQLLGKELELGGVVKDNNYNYEYLYNQLATITMNQICKIWFFCDSILHIAASLEHRGSSSSSDHNPVKDKLATITMNIYIINLQL